MSAHSYDMHSLKLTIVGEDTILAALKCRLQQFPAAKAGTPSDLRFEYREIPHTNDPGMERVPGVTRKVLDLHDGEVLYREASNQLEIDYPGRARSVCDIRSGDVRVDYSKVEADAIGLLTHPLFTIPLAELLKQHGLFMVHAAGLCLNRRGLLIAGATGSGKTTLTIAMLRAGFAFLGDDTVFLRINSDGLCALAFPDEIDATADTIRLFPELQSVARQLPASNRRKRSFVPSRVYHARVAMECTPAILVFPQPVGAQESRLTPMPKDAALLELICNVLRTEICSTQSHLNALAMLVKQCRCYRLHTGRDFDALAVRLRSLLNQPEDADTPLKPG